MEKMMSLEAMNKSIDSMIDELFTDAEFVKSIEINGGIGMPSTTADAVVNKAPKGQDDASRGAGRPKEVSDVAEDDEDGNRAKGYDSVQMNQTAMDIPEASQVKEKNMMKKSFEISPEEYEEFQELRKAKEFKEAETMKKAFLAEQHTLIKSAVAEATSGFREENEALRKTMTEQSDLLKAMANQPQRSRSITNMAAVEKSMSNEGQSQHFTKHQVLDMAEELYKAGKLKQDHVIELDNNGFIYDPAARSVLESAMEKLG